MISPTRPHCLPLAGLFALAPLSAMGEVMAPSGQPVTLHELMTEQNPWSGETQLVIRLIAPELAEDRLSEASIAADMDWACTTWGIAAADQQSDAIEWVVVEMMASLAPRGSTTPDIRRLYETYRLEGDACIWELF